MFTFLKAALQKKMNKELSDLLMLNSQLLAQECDATMPYSSNKAE